MLCIIIATVAGSTCSKHPTCVFCVLSLASSHDKQRTLRCHAAETDDAFNFQASPSDTAVSLSRPKERNAELWLAAAAFSDIISNACFFSSFIQGRRQERRDVMKQPCRADDASEATGNQVLPCPLLKIYLEARKLFWIIVYLSVVTKFFFAVTAGALIYSVKNERKLRQKCKNGNEELK